MKRLILLVIAIISIMALLGCFNNPETSKMKVDKEITGQVIALVNHGDYSTAYFNGGISVDITNKTLYYWRVNNMFINDVGTYKLAGTAIARRYDLVGLNDRQLPSTALP